MKHFKTEARLMLVIPLALLAVAILLALFVPNFLGE
jgi:hypothetical protein